MRVATMRRVDRWVGAPLCLALTAWRRLTNRRPPLPSRPSSIVFIKLAEQGSTVLAWPAVRNAIQRVGREHVFFVVFDENRPILDAVSWFPPENIVGIGSGNLWSVAIGVIAAIRRLRRLRVDAAIDLEFFARSSAILSYLTGARMRVGYHSRAGAASYRGDLCTHRVGFNPYLHTARAFETLVDALDVRPEDLPAYGARAIAAPEVPEFSPRLSDLDRARQVLEMLGCSGRPLVLLNANASDLMPLRRWPPERYVELARRFLQTYDRGWILFTGATSESSAAEQLAREVGSPRCASVAGRTTIPELLSLYTLCDALVTNDSGPAHFAAMTPIEVVTLFGPETPALFAAPTARNHPLWAGIVCSPCLSAFNNRESACTNNVCMQRISLEEVFETLVHALDRRGVGYRSEPRTAAL